MVKNSFTKNSIVLKFSPNTKISISFSEPMKKTNYFTIILQDKNNQQYIKEISIKENNLEWAENRKQVEFNLNLPNNSKSFYYVILNWWKTKNPLYSDTNILLKNSNYFKLINE